MTIETAAEAPLEGESKVEEPTGNQDSVITSEELTPEEQQALQGGWRPYEEWEGDPDQWISAKEFNQRGEYIERIKSQSSQIKGLEKKLSKVEKVISDLSEHNKKLAEREFKDNMKSLKDLKKDAMENGEYDKVVEIDDKMDELRDLQREQQELESRQDDGASTPNQGDLNPEVISWMEENTWYERDPMLRGAFDALAQHKLSDNPGLENNPKVLLEMVTEDIKKEFPHKFGGTRQRSTVAEPGTNRGTAGNASKSKPKYTTRHLTEEQRQIGERFVKAGAFQKLDEYVQQLAEIGELDVQKGR